MKTTVLSSTCEEQIVNGHKTYKYTVVSVDKYGTFTSSVRLCEQDKEAANSVSDMLGYEFALAKNRRKSLYVKKTRFYERVVQARHSYEVACARFGEDSDVAAFAKGQLNIAQRDYDKIEEKYLFLRDGFKDYTTEKVKERADFLVKADEILAKAHQENEALIKETAEN